MKMKGARVIISYILVGLLLIVLSQLIEPVVGFNLDFGNGYTLVRVLWFVGLILVAVALAFGFLMMISSKKPSQDQVEYFEKHELLLQQITLAGNVMCLAGFGGAGFLPTDHQYYGWLIWFGFGGIFVMGAPAFVQMRAIIFSQFEPGLSDERHKERFSDATHKGFHWMTQTAFLGVAFHFMFNWDFPVWFGFVAPLLMGYLGINWSLVKAIKAEEIQYE